MSKFSSPAWMMACVLLVPLALTGCASTYQHSDIQIRSVQLDPSMSVLVSVPPDGWYEDIEYRNSGKMTANAVAAAFAKHAKKVEISDDCHGDDCLEKGYGYYVELEILRWEERATEWSGRPDQIEIQIVVFDVATKTALANSSYSGKSKWITLGGDHPQDLLPEPTNQYVSTLYE